MGLSSTSEGGLVIPAPLAGPDVLRGVLMGQRQGSESEEKAMQLLLETEIQHVADGGKATRSWRAKEADPSLELPGGNSPAHT